MTVWCGHAEVVAGAPAGAGWWSLQDATEEVGAWAPALVARVGDRRAAGSYLATWLAEVPVLVLGVSAVLGEVGIVATPDRLWVHRHADGWFDRHAVDPDEVVTGPVDEVLALAGRGVAELTAPVVDVVCDALPVGRTAVWGAVADALHARALHLARQRGHDELETWRRCEVLVDALRLAAPRLRVRPRLFPVPWSGGTAHYPVRGTCCLYYRTCADDVDADLRTCSTCPLRSDDSRSRRLRHHLEATAT